MDALDRLDRAMRKGDLERQMSGKTLLWGEKYWFLDESPAEDLELFGDAAERAQQCRHIRQYEQRVKCGNCGHVHLGKCSICNACEQIEPPKSTNELIDACVCAIRCIQRNSTQAQKDWTVARINKALASEMPAHDEFDAWYAKQSPLKSTRETCRDAYLFGLSLHAPQEGKEATTRLMINRYGEIHEECPDCRGASCVPYVPVAAPAGKDKP